MTEGTKTTATRTRRPTYLVAMEETATNQLELIITADQKITTLQEMKARILEAKMVGRKFHIYRTTGEVLELQQQTKLSF